MKRTLLIITTLCLLAIGLLFAASCQKKGGDSVVVTTQDPGALIAGGEGSVFSIVYSARGEDFEMNAAMDLKYAFSNSYSSVPKFIDDSKTATEYEILVGNTNRPESSAVLDGLNDYGWAVRVIGNKIVINAKNLQFLSDAVEYFARTYVGSEEKLGINHISDHVENSEKHAQRMQTQHPQGT